MSRAALVSVALLAVFAVSVARAQVVHANFRDGLVRFDTETSELTFSDVKAPEGVFAKAKVVLPPDCGAFRRWNRLTRSACETGRVDYAAGHLDLVCDYQGFAVRGPKGMRIEGEILAGRPDSEAVFAVCADRSTEGLASVSGAAVPEGADAVFDRRSDVLFRVDGARLSSRGANHHFAFAAGETLRLSVEPNFLAGRYRIAYRPINPNCIFKTPPVGWMTWYAVKFGASDEVVMRNARGFMDNFRGYTDEKPVMWVDWEWFHDRFHGKGEDNQDMITPRTSVYPRGMKPVADDLSRMGFTPALWVSVINDVRTNALLKARQEWILGESSTWCGYLWGDPTAPGFCEEYVPSLFKLYMSWGYKAFKWDCLPAAIGKFGDFHDRFKDPSVGPEEAFRRMIAAGRRTVGPDCYLESCSGENDRPILGAIDLFDAGRIGGDIFKWSEFLNSGVNRLLNYYPLHSTVFWADADNLVLREEFSTLAQARTRASVYALAGVPITMGDEIAALDAPRLDILRRVMPVVPMHPASLARSRCPGGLMESTVDIARDFGSWRLKAWSNFTTNKTISAVFSAKGCVVWDFWQDRLLSDGSVVDVRLDVSAGDTTLVRVTPLEVDRPTLVSVSRHVTQGGYEIADLEVGRDGAQGTVKCPGGEVVKVTFLLPEGVKVETATHPYDIDGRLLRLKVSTSAKQLVPFSFRLR